MTLTHEIYEDLNKSLQNGKYQNLSKVYETPKGLSLIYAMERDTGKRSLFFLVDEKKVDSIPQCKGISIGKVHLYEYSAKDFFCQIAQNSCDEGYIYEIIIEDIRKNACELTREQDIVSMVSKLLLKWKNFFAQEKEVILSPEQQQGLYGELLFLNQLIDLKGASAVSQWTGCEYETHDFYINKNAVEIKTTSTKTPYKMHINSEFQLDDSEISGKLFINFFALKKSSAAGKKLPELVSDTRVKIMNNPMMIKKFEKKLEMYGYFDGLENKYTVGYHLREEHCYFVGDNFPRIIKKNLPEGISGCTYDVMINCCSLFEISQEEKNRVLKGSEING